MSQEHSSSFSLLLIENKIAEIFSYYNIVRKFDSKKDRQFI